jgi:hypothetical protein
MIKAFAGFTHACTAWPRRSAGSPVIGPKLKKADAWFAAISEAATKSTHKDRRRCSRGAADSIDHKVVPAIDKAQGSLDKIGKTEIVKAGCATRRPRLRWRSRTSARSPMALRSS